MLGSTTLSDEQRGWHRVLTDASQLLLMVVNDVLDYTKMDAGAMVLERAPVYVGALVSDAINLFQQRARSRRITSRTLAPDSRVTRMAMLLDPNRRTTPSGFLVPSRALATSRT